jgi:hypothetical protein
MGHKLQSPAFNTIRYLLHFEIDYWVFGGVALSLALKCKRAIDRLDADILVLKFAIYAVDWPASEWI